MKFFVSILILAVLVAGFSANAAPLEFVLECKFESYHERTPPLGAPRFEVVKSVKKVKRKWESRYILRVIPLNPTAKSRDYALEGISGDADYTEFRVLKGESVFIRSVYIQQSFGWASLVNNRGYSSYRCE